MFDFAIVFSFGKSNSKTREAQLQKFYIYGFCRILYLMVDENVGILPVIRKPEQIMGNVTPITGRTRTVAQHIRTEHDARAAISLLSANDGQPGLQQVEHKGPSVDAIFQTGLAGISVPEAYGGADVANQIIVELFMTASRHSEWQSGPLLRHFHAIEVLRQVSDTRLVAHLFERVLAGNRLSLHATTLELEEVGSGFRVPLMVSDIEDNEGADWNIYPVRWSGTKTGIAIIPARTQITALDYIEADRILPIATELEQTGVEALKNLLVAAIATGRARTLLEATIQSHAIVNAKIGRDTFAALGSLSLSIEAADALVKRSAHLLDVAQVSRNLPSTREAILASLYAKASVDAIRDYPGSVSGADKQVPLGDYKEGVFERLASIGSALIAEKT